MTTKMKRFYSQVDLHALAQGCEVHLDGRRLKSPAKADLVFPSELLGRAVQAEWQDVEDEITPQNMPYFSAASTVIDRVIPNRTVLNDELVRYAESELICYRAPKDDAELAALQAQRWDPYLKWIEDTHHVLFVVTSGIMPASQPANSVKLIGGLVSNVDDWRFSCLYRMTTLTGSFVLSYACLSGRLDINTLFDLAFLDELYQNSKWGQDEEAARRQQTIKNELNDIDSFLAML